MEQSRLRKLALHTQVGAPFDTTHVPWPEQTGVPAHVCCVHSDPLQRVSHAHCGVTLAPFTTLTQLPWPEHTGTP